MGLVALLVLLRVELLEARNTRLGLCLAPLRILTHPLQLLAECLLARGLGRLLLLEPGTLLLQPTRIISLPRDAVTAVEFQDPLGGVI